MKEKQKRKSGVARLFEIAGEKKGLLILAGILSAVSALCMLVPYWSVYEVLKELLLHGSKINELDSSVLMHWGWVAFIGLVAGLLLLYGALMASHVAAFRILYGLRIRLSEHIGRLSLGYLNGTSTGAIKKTMEQNIEKIENFVAHTIPDLVNVLATVVLMFIIFFSLNGWMAAICVVCIVCSIGLQFMNFFGKKAKEFMKIYYDTQERMSASAVQYVRGMPVVKIFGQSVRSFRQFNSEIEAYKSYALRVCDTYQSGMTAFTVLLNSLITFILPVGLLLLSREPQNIVLAAIYLFFIIMGPGVASPIYKLMYLGSSTNEIDEGVKRIDRIFDEQALPEAEVSRLPVSYDIEFRQVSFAYENKAERKERFMFLEIKGIKKSFGAGESHVDVLKGIDLEIEKGEFCVLLGPSGSGKSTVANLIPRFWDVSEGEICIGGINIKEIATEDLMNLVSFVFQDSFLFFDTLYENIRVGNTSATREQVIEAARAAQCHDFIESLPDGYNTRIGDKGVYLSGGESQRVCVARAILKNAPILVLDEATAFADPENEYKMQQAIQQLIKDKTVIIIAHRLSSIISAEQILVLKEGRLIQSGRHEVLSKTDGVYKRMWDAYTSAFRWQLTVKKEETK